jgi:cytochrome oxidase Cu insertion factor (SCO1/SenC/PrrC family)
MGSSTAAHGSLIESAFHSALVRQGAFIFLLLVLLFVAWNAYCSYQYRQSRLRGLPIDSRSSALPAEPRARRFLRIAFGMLWVIDGLLQLQPAMPLGFPSNVLQPSAATSPGWVQSVVGVAVGTWSRHPAEAAAAAVWIQLGVGVLLLVAPRGRWSQWAGIVSVGWGLVVWVVGEAFGGIFAPGLTFLFGAPGAVLFYVVAGVLVALPDRAWVGRRLGEIVTGSMGLFLLVMAVLQAWPGRGFWQGSVNGQDGTLAGMVRDMSSTPQPHALSSMVSWFATLVEGHGGLVNGVAVVLLAGLGVALLAGGRFVRPAVFVLAAFALFDWIFIEDLGVWGGTGTDPNSMLPMLFVVIGGYLALATAPATIEAGVASTTTQVAGSDGPREWWNALSPRRAARWAGAIGAVVIVVVGTAPMVEASVGTGADTSLSEAVNGPPGVAVGRAPNFDLIDQRGSEVSMTDLRGYTVVLTFLDPVCTTDCPLIAQEMRATNTMLGSDAKKVRFVAIVANPIYNSIAAVRAFNRQEGLSAQPNWLYLTGSLANLRSVWNAYGEEVEAAPAGGMAVHADIAYVIDAHGITRRAMMADPGDGQADHQSFSSLLAQEITQVMHS